MLADQLLKCIVTRTTKPVRPDCPLCSLIQAASSPRIKSNARRADRKGRPLGGENLRPRGLSVPGVGGHWGNAADNYKRCTIFVLPIAKGRRMAAPLFRFLPQPPPPGISNSDDEIAAGLRPGSSSVRDAR